MENWKEKLDKRTQKIEEINQIKSKKEKREEVERETDVIRLRGLLKDFKVKDKLQDIRERLWKREGQINELVEHSDRAQGMDVSLQLYTSYSDLEVYVSYSSSLDFFGKEIGGSFKRYFPGWSGVFIQIGITNVRETSDIHDAVNHKHGEVVPQGDYMYALFGEGTSILDRKRDMEGNFFRSDSKIHIQSNRLIIPKFIEEHLLEFTEYDRLPSSLGAVGRKKIEQSKSW